MFLQGFKCLGLKFVLASSLEFHAGSGEFRRMNHSL